MKRAFMLKSFKSRSRACHSLMYFLLALLIMSYLGIPWVAQAGGNTSPSRQARTVDFFAAVNDGSITYEAHGRGVASGAMIELTLTNLTSDPLNVILPPASRFTPNEGPSAGTSLLPGYRDLPVQWSRWNPGGQGGVGGPPTSIPLGGWRAGVHVPGNGLARPVRQEEDWTRTVIVEAYCTNAHEDNPSAGTIYTVLPPADDELTRLIQTYEQRGEPISTIAIQIAVWAITDDVDLPFLRQIGYGPNDQELREALLLLQEAGIDLSNRHLGQVEMPPEQPPTPIFEAGQTTPVQVRGSVVSEDGTAVETALVFLAVVGPDHGDLRFDITSSRGRFDSVVELYEGDTIDLIVFELGREAGRLRFTARELYDLFDGGGEIMIILRRGILPPPLPPQPPTTPGFGSTPVTLYGVRQSPDPARVRAEPSTDAEVIDRETCAEHVIELDAQTTGGDGYVWYHRASDGWMRSDTLTTFTSPGDAEAARASTNCAQQPVPVPPSESPVPPPTEEPTALPTEELPPGTWGACGSCSNCGYTSGECVLSPDGQCVWDPARCGAQLPGGGGGEGGGGGGGDGGGGDGGGPQTEYLVTIENQTTCDAAVSFGSHNATIGPGGSTSFSVPAGTYGFSANAGSCGSLSDSHTITDSGIVITLHN